MKQYVYKIIIFILAIIFIYEFTIGKQINKYGDQLNSINSKDGRKETVQKIREGIKSFSDWPTIPQLYIKKEFVGGCDIVKEMYENGELKKILEEKNISFKN